ncbi:alpha/beta fold hydrolase [Martelella lutilitoris]|uniref:Alpha/beta fold hydrolase n=1 Tax=Martelella lutilitoris TaxID=2583532 RepID=A0A7T7KKN2_9HYPH|nr:alpha/beta hydrolase [Martelella lutilitoris]QQM29807.1 alpha/beta fold hydrolase [Martelella lutilitoris]
MSGTIRRRDFFLKTRDGVRIAIREVFDAAAGTPARPMILMHGTRIPGLSEYDLDVPHGSLAADLAARGHRCYIVDARGFGRSERPAEMDLPPTPTKPLVRTLEIVRDLEAAVDHLCAVSGFSSVGLFGWGVGGTCVMAFAALWPEKASHLVLYNMVYGAAGGHPKFCHGSQWEDPARPGHFNRPHFGNYTFNAVDMLTRDWDRQIPIEDKAAWRDPAIVRAFEQALIDGDPTARDRDPPTYRSPNGMLEDLFLMGIGHRLVNANQVYARVMIVRPEFDTLSQKDDMDALVGDLINAGEVFYWEPGGTTHYILFDRPEHGRDAMLAEMEAFLAR